MHNGNPDAHLYRLQAGPRVCVHRTAPADLERCGSKAADFVETAGTDCCGCSDHYRVSAPVHCLEDPEIAGISAEMAAETIDEERIEAVTASVEGRIRALRESGAAHFGKPSSLDDDRTDNIAAAYH